MCVWGWKRFYFVEIPQLIQLTNKRLIKNQRSGLSAKRTKGRSLPRRVRNTLLSLSPLSQASPPAPSFLSQPNPCWRLSHPHSWPSAKADTPHHPPISGRTPYACSHPDHPDSRTSDQLWPDCTPPLESRWPCSSGHFQSARWSSRKPAIKEDYYTKSVKERMKERGPNETYHFTLSNAFL